jgi:hypothetical protein
VLFIGKNDLAAELKQMPKGRAMKDFALYAVMEGDLDFSGQAKILNTSSWQGSSADYP